MVNGIRAPSPASGTQVIDIRATGGQEAFLIERLSRVGFQPVQAQGEIIGIRDPQGRFFGTNEIVPLSAQFVPQDLELAQRTPFGEVSSRVIGRIQFEPNTGQIIDLPAGIPTAGRVSRIGELQQTVRFDPTTGNIIPVTTEELERLRQPGFRVGPTRFVREAEEAIRPAQQAALRRAVLRQEGLVSGAGLRPDVAGIEAQQRRVRGLLPQQPFLGPTAREVAFREISAVAERQAALQQRPGPPSLEQASAMAEIGVPSIVGGPRILPERAFFEIIPGVRAAGVTEPTIEERVFARGRAQTGLLGTGPGVLVRPKGVPLTRAISPGFERFVTGFGRGVKKQVTEEKLQTVGIGLAGVATRLVVGIGRKFIPGLAVAEAAVGAAAIGLTGAEAQRAFEAEPIKERKAERAGEVVGERFVEFGAFAVGFGGPTLLRRPAVRPTPTIESPGFETPTQARPTVAPKRAELPKELPAERRQVFERAINRRPELRENIMRQAREELQLQRTLGRPTPTPSIPKRVPEARPRPEVSGLTELERRARIPEPTRPTVPTREVVQRPSPGFEPLPRERVPARRPTRFVERIERGLRTFEERALAPRRERLPALRPAFEVREVPARVPELKRPTLPPEIPKIGLPELPPERPLVPQRPRELVPRKPMFIEEIRPRPVERPGLREVPSRPRDFGIPVPALLGLGLGGFDIPLRGGAGFAGVQLRRGPAPSLLGAGLFVERGIVTRRRPPSVKPTPFEEQLVFAPRGVRATGFRPFFGEAQTRRSTRNRVRGLENVLSVGL